MMIMIMYETANKPGGQSHYEKWPHKTCTSVAGVLEEEKSQKGESVINSKNRTPSYVERDKYRNPLNTLSFFKIKNNMKVIELQPSGGNSPGGWYTEILAPYLKKNGLLIAAHFNPKESE